MLEILEKILDVFVFVGFIGMYPLLFWCMYLSWITGRPENHKNSNHHARVSMWSFLSAILFAFLGLYRYWVDLPAPGIYLFLAVALVYNAYSFSKSATLLSESKK